MLHARAELKKTRVSLFNVYAASPGAHALPGVALAMPSATRYSASPLSTSAFPSRKTTVRVRGTDARLPSWPEATPVHGRGTRSIHSGTSGCLTPGCATIVRLPPSRKTGRYISNLPGVAAAVSGAGCFLLKSAIIDSSNILSFQLRIENGCNPEVEIATNGVDDDCGDSIPESLRIRGRASRPFAASRECRSYSASGRVHQALWCSSRLLSGCSVRYLRTQRVFGKEACAIVPRC